MDPHMLERVAGLLRDAPGHTLSLASLREALAVGGADAPGADLLAAALAGDARFSLAGAADPIHAVALDWDGPTRDRYRAAVGAAGCDLFVSLCDPAIEPDHGTLALLAASLRQLRAAPDLPGVAARIAEAHAEYGALARAVPHHSP